MKKKILSMLLCMTMVSTLLIGCGKTQENNKTEKLKIVASNYVLADFAKELTVGQNVDIQVLLDSGEDPGLHEVTNKDISTVNDADIFIYNGADAEPWFFDLTESIEENILVIDAAESINIKTDKYNINYADSNTYTIKTNTPEEGEEKEEPIDDVYVESTEGSETTNNSESTNKTESTEAVDNQNSPSESNSGASISAGSLISKEFKTPNIIPDSFNDADLSQVKLGKTYNLGNSEFETNIINKMNEISTSGKIIVYDGSKIFSLKYYNKSTSKFQITEYDSKNFCEMDLYSQDNIYIEQSAYDKLMGNVSHNYNLSNFPVNSKIIQRTATDEQKKVLNSLALLYEDDTDNYCLYDESSGEIGLFQCSTDLGKLTTKLLSIVSSYAEIEAMTTKTVICDSKAYSALQGANTNATTEENQYHNYWMNINNAKIMVDNIYDGLVLKDETNIEAYTKNHDDYIEILDSLDNRYKKVLETAKYKVVVLTGDFNCFYLLNYLGLDYLSVYDNEYQTESPTITRQANIVKFLKDNSSDIKYVLTEGNDTSTKTITGETNTVALNLDSMVNVIRNEQNNEENTYYQKMENNLVILSTILNN